MHNHFPLYLPNKRQGKLILPTPLTEAELGMLEEQINNALWITKEVSVTPEQQPTATPRQAGESEEV